MVDGVALRVAQAGDAAAITALSREAYAKWVPVQGREPLPMTADYAEALKTHRFDLLGAGGELAALIETVREGDELLIVNVAVRPGFQKRGFGVRLLRLAEQLAVEGGLRGTRLYTNKLFTENIALYESLGYVLEREEDMGFAIRVHMARPLSTVSGRRPQG
jgi:ribosomal protein S18 acetylase RimI-like enzyme